MDPLLSAPTSTGKRTQLVEQKRNLFRVHGQPGYPAGCRALNRRQCGVPATLRVKLLLGFRDATEISTIVGSSALRVFDAAAHFSFWGVPRQRHGELLRQFFIAPLSPTTADTICVPVGSFVMAVRRIVPKTAPHMGILTVHGIPPQLPDLAQHP